jgi:hypothetical protein
MNRKAAVIHFILYAVVLGVGIVLLFSTVNLFTFEAKGSSQYEFLGGTVTPLEKEKIEKSAATKKFIRDEYAELIQNAGFFVPNARHELNGVPYWDKETVLDIDDKLLEKLKLEYPEQKIQLKKGLFTFKANQINMEEISQRGYYYSYEHSPQFKVNIEHLLYEFEVVYDLSQQMLLKCEGSENLDTCINKQNEEKSYSLNVCEDNTEELKRTFCVNSNHLKTNYRFSLDFTP